jgi:trigger factor
MKKKAVALLLCVSMMMTLNACGKTNKDNTQGTETVAETETEVIPSSADITYDAGDYVSLGDYMNMEVTLDKDYQVTDDMVKNYVNNNVIANYPYYVESDKTVVENGDVANIDYEGLLDGEAFDGGTAQDYDLEIGSGSFIDGFEDGLIGAEVGKETDLNLTFPEDYGNSDLAGKEVVFKVTVNAIKEKQDITYDTLTDEYVTYLSDKLGASYETVNDLTSDIRTYLEEQANSSRTQAIRSAVIAKLPEVCTVNALPDGLLDARMQEYLKKFEDTYCKDTTLEDYLSSTYNTTVDDFKTQVQSEIETELDTQLILEAIAAVENIEFDEDGFNSYVSSLLSSYGYDSEDALYENYAQTAEDGKVYLQTIYLCNKALDRVIENTNVTYNAAEESTEEAAAAEDITETEAATEE